MKKKKVSKGNASTRRDVLKKAGTATAFIVPTIASFKIADLAVAGSGGAPPSIPDGLPNP